MVRHAYIVDDDEVARSSLEDLLSLQQDLKIMTFPSGDAFIGACGALEAGVLLLDFNMDGANGMDVMLHVNADPGLRFAVIMLTGAARIELAVQAMKAGAVDFLEKPYRADTLIDRIDFAFAALERSSASAEHAAQARSSIDRLTPRERDVLLGLLDGHANKTIAARLAISARTVEIYRANLMAKLNVRSLAEALRIAFVGGLLTPEPAITTKPR